MGLSEFPSSSVVLVFLISFALLIPQNTAPDIFNLVYKTCAKQTLEDMSSSSRGSSSFQNTLTTLFTSLVSQSATTRFFNTTSGSGPSTVSGLFQCRADLGNDECNSCVQRIPKMVTTSCGYSVSARLQLVGCYLHYQTQAKAEDSKQVSGTEIQYKTCSSSKAIFEDNRDAAFAILESGIAEGSGFYSTTHDFVHVVGQCEGELSVIDCVECVKVALQQAEEECGSAISGQVYLHQCFISYNYDPDGEESNSSSGESSGSGQTAKTAAAIVGGAFALFFGVVCLLFLKSLWKKRDGY